jgi:hypothetical protein
MKNLAIDCREAYLYCSQRELPRNALLSQPETSNFQINYARYLLPAVVAV